MTETRYAQVARHLTESIGNGRFPVGSTLPTALELCEQYGGSRHPIRAAIRELQELGMVSRRKKAGTRVEAASPTGGYRQSLASVEDLVQFGAAHTRGVQTNEEGVADPAPAQGTGLCRRTVLVAHIQPAHEWRTALTSDRVDRCLCRRGLFRSARCCSRQARCSDQRVDRIPVRPAYRRNSSGCAGDLADEKARGEKGHRSGSAGSANPATLSRSGGRSF